jgi:hypothetical protein
MYDRFTVVIKSNGQDKASLCQDYYDDLDVDSVISNVTYKIGSGDEEGWKLKKVLNIDVAGLDYLMQVERNCADALYMSLDAEIGGLWQSLWRESPDTDVQICEGEDGVIHYGTHYDSSTGPAVRRLATDASTAGMVKCSEIQNNEFKWIYINKTSSFTQLEIRMTQADYIEHAQFLTKTSNLSVTINMRVSLKNTRGDVVQGTNPIAFPFTATIVARDEVNKCAAATIDPESVSVVSDRYIAFSASDETTGAGQAKSYEINHVLKASSSDKNCPVKFKLQMALADGVFYDYDQTKHTIEEDGNFNESRFPIEIYWDEDKAFLSVEISSTFENVIDFFTINGETSIWFNILAILPGSDNHGPALPDSQQV